MVKVSHILVPTDFSPLALAALDHAADLARLYGAKVTVLHAAQPAHLLSPGAMHMLEPGGAELARGLEETRQALLQRGVTDATAVAVEGDPARQIVAQPADLIVISSHGRSGLAHAVLGSVAEQVVRTASCPVLVVRPRT